MITGMGMPRTHRRMPRMFNSVPSMKRKVGAVRGGTMADAITSWWASQSQPDAGKERWPRSLITIHRFPARVEQVASVGEELDMWGDVISDRQVEQQPLA